MLLTRWNARTALAVAEPNTPSAPPRTTSPVRWSATWSALTVSPLAPCFNPTYGLLLDGGGVEGVVAGGVVAPLDDAPSPSAAAVRIVIPPVWVSPFHPWNCWTARVVAGP